MRCLCECFYALFVFMRVLLCSAYVSAFMQCLCGCFHPVLTIVLTIVRTRLLLQRMKTNRTSRTS